MSMMGFEMLFPVIKVKDKDTGSIHILGTDRHDTLYVDDSTGGLHYMNLQNCEGTVKNSCYEFMSESENQYSPYTEVEFVTFDEFLEIYKKQIGITVEKEKYFREVLIPSLFKMQEQLDTNEKDGISHT